MSETQALRTAVARHCDALLPRDRRIVVAVSGGVDSLALLHLLVELAPERGWQLAVAHLNHRQDPAIDDRAMTMLAGLAEALQLPYFAAEADLPLETAEAPLRLARYAFLGRVCREWQAPYLALAHHADDQAETVLLRLLRGAVAGLGGMRAARPLDGEMPAVTVVRPLLGVRKAQLQAFADEQGLPVIADPSNDKRRFRRNTLRHDVLPLLESQWPGTVPVLQRTALWLADDESYLQAEAERVVHSLPPAPAAVPIEALVALPGPILRRVLRALLQARTQQAPDGRVVADAMAVVQGEQPRADLGRHWTLSRQGGWLSVVPNEAAPAGGEVPLTLAEGETSLAPDWPYRALICRGVAADAADAAAFFLPDAWAETTWCWRGARPGDRFVGPAGRQKVGEVLRALGVPAALRGRALVLAAGSEVAWIAGRRKGLPGATGPGWVVSLKPQAVAQDG